MESEKEMSKTQMTTIQYTIEHIDMKYEGLMDPSQRTVVKVATKGRGHLSFVLKKPK